MVKTEFLAANTATGMTYKRVRPQAGLTTDQSSYFHSVFRKGKSGRHMEKLRLFASQTKHSAKKKDNIAETKRTEVQQKADKLKLNSEHETKHTVVLSDETVKEKHHKKL